MICPYCNKEMEKGYIDQTDFRFPLEWTPDETEYGFFGLTASKKRNVRLTSTMKGGSMIAYRCGECRKIIIDEATLEI